MPLRSKFPLVSIIIPVLGEGKKICQAVERLLELELSHSSDQLSNHRMEILIVDGSPQRSTITALAGSFFFSAAVPLHLLSSPAGRGVQMNMGARTAAGDILLFLHVDTLLPVMALKDIQSHFRRFPDAAGAFSLGINSPRPCYRIIESFANIRSRIFGAPYGDQAIFLSRDLFFRVGGYPDYPIMEDLELMRRIKKNGAPIRILPGQVRTSARRWEREGVILATLRNWMLAGLYTAGMAPERLARFYR